jgi:MFS family permease
MKVLFAMGYIMQGLANPFQGITYHSFFRHFRFDYGMTEAATQSYFAHSYLAWSFKPVIGFFIDAFGKTKVILIILLLSATVFYLLTPVFDVSAWIFFGLMFALSILFASTDVAVDRATIIVGDEEAKISGKSKAATVGFNQAICWSAIYGTSIIAGLFGGWIADHVKIEYMMFGLALVPIAVLLVVTRLPKDTEVSIPIKQSLANFWAGLNTGPIVWIILFYFLFHFQPALGAIWTNYTIEELGFTQTQIGIADGVANFGFFLGVLLFVFLGIILQDKFGLRNVFRLFIFLSILVNLTQYLLVEPYFTRITAAIAARLSFTNIEIVQLTYFVSYYFFSSVFISFIQMSTFSLVGAVIPVNAAGSLYAGFMSVANLAYSFSYTSGSWLYENGLYYEWLRVLQQSLFGIQSISGDKMSIGLLIFIGSIAYILSYVCVHKLPDRKQTRAVEEQSDYLISPEHFNELGEFYHRTVNYFSLTFGIVFFSFGFFLWELGIIASAIISFFGATFIRKVFQDWRYNAKLRKKMRKETVS